jgi:predicted MFS family arabinose efflux permease
LPAAKSNDVSSLALAKETQGSSVLWIAGGLGILATVTVAVLPALVAVWRDSFALRLDQSGYLAATEIYAQVAGSGGYIAMRSRASWRAAAILGLLLLAFGNVVPAISGVFSSLLVSRALAGMGAGLLRSQCMSALASARNPGLLFAIYASVQVAVAAAVTIALPALIAVEGSKIPFLILAAVSGSALYVCRWLPRFSHTRGSSRTKAILPVAGMLALAALFVFFLGQGGFWTYLNPIGKSRLIDQKGISVTLSVLNLAGLAGTLGIGALAHRLPPRSALIFLMCLSIASVGMLYRAHSTTMFMWAACGFYFSWCASFPFQFALIAEVDPSQTASAAIPAVDALGLASGGAVAGMLLPILGIDAPGWVCAAGTLIGIFGYLLASRLSRGVQTPARVL